MSQADKAKQFAALHKKGEPIVLYNIWDAGTAQAATKAGAKAVATGSASVAAAHGYGDGEEIPLSLVEIIASRIAESVDVPFSLDFEGAYADSAADVKENAARIIKTGAVGVNFEDQKVQGAGLYSVDEQCARIAAFGRLRMRQVFRFSSMREQTCFCRNRTQVNMLLLLRKQYCAVNAMQRPGLAGFSSLP